MRIPRNLVIFNLGFDEDCDCFDLDKFDETTGEYEIKYWYPGYDDITTTHLDFPSYMQSHLTDFKIF